MSLRFSHFARSSEIYEEPLSDSSLGRWRTLALSSPAASSAISSVAVTAPALLAGPPFHATIERGKRSGTVQGPNHPPPRPPRKGKPGCRRGLGTRGSSFTLP